MTQPMRASMRPTLIMLLFAAVFVVDMFLPGTTRQQSAYRLAWAIFAMLVVLYFAYTRRMPEQRNVRTASVALLAGMLASFAADRVGPSPLGFTLQGVAFACSATAIIVFALDLRRAARAPAVIGSH
jgi:RsiW-degrading membrane proteinase PrsW (M82 family)